MATAGEGVQGQRPREWFFQRYSMWMYLDLKAWDEASKNGQNVMEHPMDWDNFKKLKTLHWVTKIKEKHFQNLIQMRTARDLKQEKWKDEKGKEHTVKDKKDWEDEALKIYEKDHEMLNQKKEVKTDNDGNIMTLPGLSTAFQKIQKIYDKQVKMEHEGQPPAGGAPPTVEATEEAAKLEQVPAPSYDAEEAREKVRSKRKEEKVKRRLMRREADKVELPAESAEELWGEELSAEDKDFRDRMAQKARQNPNHNFQRNFISSGTSILDRLSKI